MSYEVEGVKQVDAGELKDILENKKQTQVIIDVREPEEYDEGHIPGVPLLPMHQIPNAADQFENDKEYIFVCRSGNRSQNVSLYLKQNGVENVANYDGGMISWSGDVATGIEKQISGPGELPE